jgi:hypothetical protein
LGAGQTSVRLNGIAYEAVAAAVQRRRRCELYHSALVIELPGGRYTVEMTPVPDAKPEQRGVVGSGPVGLRQLGRLRLFRYEIRRWRDGFVPDLQYAVASPIRIATHPALVRHIFDLVACVPTPVWGRDELHAGEMWSCNSVVSWTLATAGVDLDLVSLPPRARAPGWDAGIVVAARSTQAEARRDSGLSPLPETVPVCVPSKDSHRTAI